MPFPYQASATPVRTRKPLRDRDKDREKDRERDKDARSITSSGTRRHREASRSSNRSPLPSSSQPSSVYSQGNVTLDQLPPLPRSETASPSSLRSPTLRASTGPSSSSTPLTSSTHLYTPAALQQYLETDDNEEYDDVQTPQASSMVHTKQYFEPEVTRTPYRPESAQKRSPVSSTAPPDTETKPASPPIPSASPLSLSRVNTRLSDPSPSLHHPRPFNFASSKPAFTQPLPLFAGPPSEPYLPHFPPGSQYFPMTHQASNQPIDIQSLPPQNYYQPYASPPQMPPSFNPMRSPPAREYSSQSSRISFSGDPPLAESAPAAPPPPLAASSQGAPKRDEDAILHRIQSAIPDLHLIVNQYREIAGQLNERDLKLRHTEAEKTKVLEQRDTYIDRLTKERDEAFHKNDEENKKHNEEKSKLRLEVGNMSEQLNELHEKFQKETRVKRDLENQLENMRAHCALRESESKAEKTAMGNEYALWKSQTDGELAAMEKALRMKEGECDRLQRQLRELEAQFQARTAESEQNRRMEKEGLELTMAKQKKELEDICTKLQRELDDTKSAHGKALDMHLKKHNQEKEIWTQDRQSLMRDWERERAKTGQGSAELHAQHQKEKEELQENWKASRLRLENEHSEAMAKMQAEMNSAKASWDADKAQFNRVKAELKATAAQLNTENTKLQKLADAFEQVTDLRGRGDAY
ncbi:MAG: hypothetical protein LQ345_006552 [Seirophora villosa]|nr:MAG: hypothetical protein LQ345_006552 [Seirophora villosa]